MTARSAAFTVRAYRPDDEAGWLRCRVLSFLGTQYYDDVRVSRHQFGASTIELVATLATESGETSGAVIGVLDIDVEKDAATIETIATHPDHQGAGVATGLLSAALPLLHESSVATLDAWTREDVAANRWYQHNGFAEQFRYVHVYVGDGDDVAGFTTPEGLSRPVSAFVHGRIEDESELRARYRRVYICRQYLRRLR